MEEQAYKIPKRIHFFSDGSIKALQEIPLILPDPKSSADVSKVQIETWMQLAQTTDKQIGIKRSVIPCLPVSILNREDSEKCFNLAKAIGETAQLDFLPDNHDQACWYLTLKYYQQALGVAIAQKLYPQCLYNPFHPLDILLNPKSKYFEYILDSLELNPEYRLQIANSLLVQSDCIEKLLDSGELGAREIEKLLRSLQLDSECRLQFLESVDKFNGQGLFCSYLPYKSVRNLIRGTQIDLACYRLVEAGFSILKAKAEAEERFFNFQNHTELFLQILRDKFQTAWLLNPLNDDYQWASKKLQTENITAKVRILEGKYWDTDNIATKSKYNFFRLKELSFDSEATPQYIKYLKTSDWSSYWLYVFYDFHTQLLRKNNSSADSLNELFKQYAQLVEKNQWSSQPISEIPSEHIEGYIYFLWKDYLKIYKKYKDTFIDEFDWSAGKPLRSRTTSNRQAVRAEINDLGYIYWVWA